MFICSLCKPSKRYIRVNHSTFHQHLRAEHFIKDGRVAKCLICSMTFNNVKTAQKHAELTHKKILTNRKLRKDVCKIIEERADPSNAIIDITDKQWTTQLRHVECFAHITKCTDCFTCSIKPTQQKLQQEKTPPIKQTELTVNDKMTQVDQPRKCHTGNMTELDFTDYNSGRVLAPSMTPYRSAFETNDGRPYQRYKFDFC